MNKGLRPVLGGVVPMHEGACETGSQIPRALTRQIGLHDYNMTLSISPH